ncbi:DUF58 domain-containing protein [Myxococcota bacterium]|nr:DUF58 domain-containing protein [Myxococcota bacterium]
MILWDPNVLARVRRLHLLAVQTVEGLLHGGHKSRRVGANVEFADYKDYSPGDSLRDLDWKVLARSDRLVVRRYEVETELQCVLVLDASGDLSTGQGSPYTLPELEGTKFGYSLVLTATLAYYLIKQQEPVGLLVLGGSGPGAGAYLPARGGGAQLARMRRGLVALISDLMEEPEGWMPSLSALSRRRPDLAVFHVMDRRELTLDFERPALYFSPEGGEALPIDPIGAAPELRGVLNAWLEELRGGLAEHRGRYYPAWTDLPLHAALAPMITGRRAMPDRDLGAV